tara:strand:- start:41115 stop:42260 length:1146 start_codon:yes stop_codon:yes gene_type:complete
MSDKTTNVNLITNTSIYRKLMVIAVFGVILLTLLFYVINKLDLNKQNCQKIGIFNDQLSISPVDYNNDNVKPYYLRDFYIKGAYNCCCAGEFKNDYVNLCALENAIHSGARFLDFEIYSIDKKPVIAASSVNNPNYKEMYNYIPFDKAMETVKTQAFASSYCPTSFSDPLILFFRINTNHKKIYDEMGNIIIKKFSNGSYLLPAQYGYEYNGENITALPLNIFKKKVIIAVLKENALFSGSKLETITNITAGPYSSYLKLHRASNIDYNNNVEELQQFNRLQMSIVLPDVKAENKNINSTKSYDLGCQIVGMSCQNFDEELKFNNKTFETADPACSFVLKPSNLRPSVTVIPAVEPVPATHSCIPLKRCMMKGKNYTCSEF